MRRKNTVHLTLEDEGSNSQKVQTTHPAAVSCPRQPEFLNSSDTQTVCLEIFGHTKTLTMVFVQHTDAFETLGAVSAGAD